MQLEGVQLREEVFTQLKIEIPERGFAVLDDFLSPEEVSQVLYRFHQLEDQDAFKQAGVGKLAQHRVVTQVRGDIIRWIDPEESHPSIKPLIDKTKALMAFFHEYFRLPLYDFEMHYTEYPPGKFYRRHRDCFRDTQHRLISFVYYFNEGWKPADGGELRLYSDNGCTDIAPLSQRLVVFKSEMEHEVMVTNCKRYSITGWMLDKPKDLTFL